MRHNRFEGTPIGEEFRPGLILSLLIVTLLWAGIYLPGLGSIEIRGEEGRRILPAIEMMQSGEWIVPHLGGEPYLRKPPLINWVIAGAIRATGQVNEWSARLPSVLAFLLMAWCMVIVIRRWLGESIALTATLISLTMFGMMGKGRLIEIEAVFTALSAIGMIAWLAWRERSVSPWIYWTLPFVPLGLAALAKGPVHLLFFYAIVVGVVWSRKEWKSLLHPAHFVGLLIGSAIFLAWLLPYRRGTANLDVAAVWAGQTTGRFTGEFSVAGWLLNIPRAASDTLPWLLWLPLLWCPVEPGVFASWKGVRNATLAVTVGMLLLPAVLPRYVMPVFPVLALLLAFAAHHAIARWGWLRRLVSPRPWRIAVGVAMAMAVGMIIYSVAVVPRIQKREHLREAGERIQQSVPPGGSLHALDPGFLPVLFYVRSPVVYLRDDKEIPDPCPALLLRDQEMKKIERKFATVNRLFDPPGEGKRDTVLVGVAGRR